MDLTKQPCRTVRFAHRKESCGTGREPGKPDFVLVGVDEPVACDNCQRMIAYKFRSSAQIPFALDIIFEHRLYCSDWRSLNDIVEGTPVISCPRERERHFLAHADAVQKHMEGLRVCSLSLTFNSHLLWAHYASAWDGLAVQVEVPDLSENVHRVDYRGFMCPAAPDRHTVAEDARRVLSSKHFEWSYEQEIRIITESQWFNLATPVKRVIAGSRMNPAMLEALRIICEKKNVALTKTGIGDEGIDADRVYARATPV